MSRLREQFRAPPPSDVALAAPPTGDLTPFVIFTQLRTGGPWIYAGWLEAADAPMAMTFAKEHYGQDQECVGVCAIAREHITSSDGLYPPPGAAHGEPAVAGAHRSTTTPPPSPAPESRGRYVLFTQKRAGDLFIEAGAIDAVSPQHALELTRATNRMAQHAHCIWAVAKLHMVSSGETDLIWRHTDQSYRLARGYGRDVRAKWIAFRDEKQLAEYEKDDLADAF
jgi:1,2-phenylacetyl-CoA epoxidase PaaB subunit